MNRKTGDQTGANPDLELSGQAAEKEKLDRIAAMTQAAVAAIEDKKGQDAQVLQVTEKTTLADVFILASGTSSIHVKTLAEAVEERLEELFGLRPDHIEGLENRSWVLLDYGDLIVHLMQPEDRMHYQLENLWRVDLNRKQLD
ncbi:MAG: ribosome silencing factor [Saccharofermentanales bacterium]